MSFRKADLEKSFFIRNSGVSGGAETKKNPNDAWRTFLTTQASPGTGSYRITDLEMRFLRAKGYGRATLHDSWDAYLIGKGFTTGSLAERRQKWLNTGTP